MIITFQTEECPINSDDFFASILKMEEDPQLDFDLIGKDLETSPSSSSDSGFSSTPSLSYEQQLSPLLSINNEEEQIEISNCDLSSPQDFMDFESASSPIQSLSSMDSPIRSVVSSTIDSPAPDVAEEMDYGQTLVAVVTPNNTISNESVNVVNEKPAIGIGER